MGPDAPQKGIVGFSTELTASRRMLAATLKTAVPALQLCAYSCRVWNLIDTLILQYRIDSKNIQCHAKSYCWRITSCMSQYRPNINWSEQPEVVQSFCLQSVRYLVNFGGEELHPPYLPTSHGAMLEGSTVWEAHRIIWPTQACLTAGTHTWSSHLFTWPWTWEGPNCLGFLEKVSGRNDEMI